MKAMILAAGRGERMRPLTDNTPKPLLLAAGKPIIVHTIEQLVAAGFDDIVINTAYLGAQISAALGDGEQWGIRLSYSDEGPQALETAGGIVNALPLLGRDAFLVVNGDIASDFDFARLLTVPVALAHLVLIDNPEHHPAGDFNLAQNGLVSAGLTPTLTFSGIGVYHPDLFQGLSVGVHKLAPLLRQAMQANAVTGEHFTGFWMDIGTPERLAVLDQHYRS